MRHNRLSTAAAELSTAESPEERAVSTPSQQVAHRLSTEVTAQVTIVFRSVAWRSLRHTTLSRTRHPQRTGAHPHPGNKLRTGYPQARIDLLPWVTARFLRAESKAYVAERMLAVAAAIVWLVVVLLGITELLGLVWLGDGGAPSDGVPSPPPA